MDAEIMKLVSNTQLPTGSSLHRVDSGYFDDWPGSGEKIADQGFDEFNAIKQGEVLGVNQPVAAEAGENHTSLVAKFVETQDEMLRTTLKHTDNFQMQLEQGNMTMNEITSQGIAMTKEIALTAVNFQVGTSLAKSSQQPLQTLMKNQ